MYVYAEGQYHAIDHFEFDIYAVKSEQKNERVDVEQSAAGNRKRMKFEPVIIKQFCPKEDYLVYLKRLHISKVTKNNKIINNLPNAKQRYFNLIVEIKVVTTSLKAFILNLVESEKKLIVRVSLFIF